MACFIITTINITIKWDNLYKIINNNIYKISDMIIVIFVVIVY